MLPLSLQLGEALVHRFSQVLYRCFEEVGSTKAAVYLREPGSEAFHLISHFGWPRILPPPELLPKDDPLLRRTARERRGFVVDQAAPLEELARFSLGTEPLRFLVMPVFDRGEWIGLLLQKDRSRGMAFDLDRDEARSQSVCQEFAETLRSFRSGQPPAAPPPASAPMTLEVPVPPSAAMVPSDAPVVATPVSEESLEGFHQVPGEAPGFASLPAPHVEPSPTRHRHGLFMPEQRTFFWEAASLLNSFVPMAAVALWMDEAEEIRPILTYSHQPLTPELKQQVMAHITFHVKDLHQPDLQILTKVEYLEKEPLTGAFLTYLPVMLRGEGEGQDLLLLFRRENRPFNDREQSFIQMVGRMVGFHLQEIRLHERYHRAFLSVSHQLLGSVEGGAPKLQDHSMATAKLAQSFAMHLELPAAELEAVCIASILHDVGTFLLDPELLAKPGLNEEELASIRTHPVLATTFLKDFRFPFDVLGIIRHHHERWDGAGYPDGLKGEAIPLGSRIINLVEAFEVMSEGSAFQEPRLLRDILNELRRGSGGQFDPTLVAEFLEFLQVRGVRW